MVIDQVHEEVNEANFTYLLLAKQMIQQDMTAAMFCLGISEETAKLVAKLKPAQLLKLPAELACYQTIKKSASAR